MYHMIFTVRSSDFFYNIPILIFVTGIRPDVVPGPSDNTDAPTFETFKGEPTPTSSAKHGSKPKHKRQDQVKQLSYNHSRYKNHLPVFFLNFFNVDLRHVR